MVGGDKPWLVGTSPSVQHQVSLLLDWSLNFVTEFELCSLSSLFSLLVPCLRLFSLLDEVLGVCTRFCDRPAELTKELLALKTDVNLETFLAHIYKTSSLECKHFATTMFAVRTRIACMR